MTDRQTLQTGGTRNPGDLYCWRTREGEFLKPHDMDTRHLFYTWLMIWNHAAPPELRVWFSHRYVFTSFYPPRYMLQSFGSLLAELKTRTDLGYKSTEVLESIESLYRDNRKRIEWGGHD